MRFYDIIAKKRDGGTLSETEITFFAKGAADGSIPDYQLSALLMAIYLRGMDEQETIALTLAMAASGERIDLSALAGPTVDKHSTGGVGDKTTLVAAPIAAACGINVPKMSGRGLGHTGGTIDKLEAIPGLKTTLSPGTFLAQVEQIGVAITGQSGNFVPADKKLYALRDVTATVGSIPLIAASVMSKKLAAGAGAILLDVKTGSGALLPTLEESIALAQAMVAIGARAGRPTEALISDMDRPLGAAVGNGVEVAEAVRALREEGPEDLLRLSLELAASMLYLGGYTDSAGRFDRTTCLLAAETALAKGHALAKLRQMVNAQGGDVAYIDEPDLLCRAAFSLDVPCPADGIIAKMDTEVIGAASVALGAGRTQKDAPVDPTAGLLLYAKTGDTVRKGEPLARLQGAGVEKLREAALLLPSAYTIEQTAPPQTPLVLARVSVDGVEYFSE